MEKLPARLILGALALGWLFDFLFWKRPFGINYPLFMILIPAVGFLILGSAGISPARTSLPLLVPVVFFSLLAFIRSEPLTLFLAISISILSLSHYFITYRGGRWLRFGLADILARYLRLGFQLLFAPLEYIPRATEYLRTRPPTGRRFPVLPLVRGLAISIPAVLILGSLLISADVVFHQWAYEFGQFFRIENLGENIFRLCVIAAIGHLFAGLFLGAEANDPHAPLLGEEKPLLPRFVGFVETTTLLASVTLLFTVFVVVQFRYFFGGEVNIGVEGFTYSQYARRGFNEILVVAAISLAMIVGLSHLSRRETDHQRCTFLVLIAALGVLVLVMLVSAYYRLELAIQWHGFSRLRFYPRIFLFWLGLLIVAVVVLEFMRRQRYFTSAFLIAALGFAVTLALLNVDASIVHYNVFRARQGKHFNVTHLALLSIDAVPALAEEFRNPDLPASIREGVGAALFCHLSRTEGWELGGWRSYHLTRAAVDEIRVELGAELAGYAPLEENIRYRVRGPSGMAYQCWAPEGEY